MPTNPLLARGATADILALGENRVLKRFAAHVPRAWVEREYACTLAVQETGLPVPRAHALVEHEGRPAIVYDRVEGITVAEAVRRRPVALPELARTLAELQARVHAVRVPELPPVREVVELLIGLNASTPAPLREAALHALERLPEGDALCHLDYHDGNVLLTDSGPVIIDWMSAARGDPVADVARTRQLLGLDHLPPGSFPPPLRGRAREGAGRAQTGAMRRLGYRLYLRHYRELRPAPAPEIAAWRLPLVAARLFGYPEERQRPMLALMARLAGA